MGGVPGTVGSTREAAARGGEQRGVTTYRMTEVEQAVQQKALREFVFAWWDCFGRQSVSARQLSELADERGLAFSLFIRHNSLEPRRRVAVRLAWLLRKLDYDDVRIDRIQIHVAEYITPL